MRITLAQVRTLPTRLDHNVAAILLAMERASDAGSDLVVFPELAIPGYGCLDHFENPRFIDRNLAARDRVIAASAKYDLAAIFGFVDRDESDPRRFYNSAAVVQRGQLLATVDKTLLPNYDIFWESKYFAAARHRRPVAVNGISIGLQICEDLWEHDYPVSVSDDLIASGAELLINISASPFSVGKLERRRALVDEVVGRHTVPFVYVNLVGSQDGYEGETVFDGRSFAVAADGLLLATAAGFEEVVHTFDTDSVARVPTPETDAIAELYGALTLGIHDYFQRNGFSRAYVGLSGGIDSAVTAAIAVRALGADNVIGVTMPSHVTSDETKNDAILLAERLGMPCRVRPIGALYAAWKATALEERDQFASSLTPQNAQARLRGLILMECSNEDPGAIVISTGNKTELALGYCTLYGDMCGGLAAISDVSKHRVYDLARAINREHGRDVIPVTTIDRPPTAELEPDQTDADNLPADYDVLSPLVEEIVEEGTPRAQLVQRYDGAVVDRTLQLIFRSEYKRRQAAPGIRVSSKAFGAGRRYPIDGEVPQ